MLTFIKAIVVIHFLGGRGLQGFPKHSWLRVCWELMYHEEDDLWRREGGREGGVQDGKESIEDT